MDLKLGPILNLRATEENFWDLSILVVSKTPTSDLNFRLEKGECISRSTLYETKGFITSRFDVRVAREKEAVEVKYFLGFDFWIFNVPARDTDPQMTFLSCNGFSAPSEIKKVDDKNAMWKALLFQHRVMPYNLMIMGGDQVYADEIWERCSEIKKWVELPRSKRRERKFTSLMRDQVDRFYFDLYCQRWKQPVVAEALASIPTIMMWDDHDIFDGWGSYAAEDQECEVYQGIFNIARKYFALFQQQLSISGDEKHPSALPTKGFSTALRVGNYLVLSLDTRTERTQKQVLSRESWDLIWHHLDDLLPVNEGGPKHLLFVSPVPVVHADFGSIESLMGWLPGEQELEDDLRDHWQSPNHRAERLRMIHRLLGLMSDKSCRVTILSGDVHVACLGVIESERGAPVHGRSKVINQLTASGIVHPSPPKLMGWLLTQLSDEVEPIEQGITARMMELPTQRKKYILARNFLSLEPDKENRLWANWYVEGLDTPVTKVIHAIQ